MGLASYESSSITRFSSLLYEQLYHSFLILKVNFSLVRARNFVTNIISLFSGEKFLTFETIKLNIYSQQIEHKQVVGFGFGHYAGTTKIYIVEQQKTQREREFRGPSYCHTNVMVAVEGQFNTKKNKLIKSRL